MRVQPGDLAQLAVADPVAVTYTTSGTNHTATRIERAQAAAARPVKQTGYQRLRIRC